MICQNTGNNEERAQHHSGNCTSQTTPRQSLGGKSEEVPERSGPGDDPGQRQGPRGGETEDHGEGPEVGVPGGPSSDHDQDLLVGQVEGHRQLGQDGEWGEGLGDQLAGDSVQAEDQQPFRRSSQETEHSVHNDGVGRIVDNRKALE